MLYRHQQHGQLVGGEDLGDYILNTYVYLGLVLLVSLLLVVPRWIA